MKRLAGSAISLLLGGALAVACGLDTEGTLFPLTECDGCAASGDGGGTDAVPGADALVDPDGAGDGAGGDGAGGDGSSGKDGSATDAPADGSAACVSNHGPAMVRVAGSTGATFCIDSTEVTNLQYAAFATTNLPATTSQPTECAWNGSFIQSSIPDLIGHGDNPAAFVDWCDAHAFCAWAGKRLCGKIGGGATAANETDDASVSQWYAACTAAGTRVFPYGATYALTLCTGEKSGSDFTTPVTTGTCVGGSPGLFDMSGNVAEWSDACVPAATPDKDLCEVRGGGGLDLQAGLRCDAIRAEKRNAALKDVGFRCCSL